MIYSSEKNLKIEGNNLVKSNFTWFGKCFELTKKQFKKPLSNGMFEIEKS
jgi:hypothetical protein